jgi:hypothetical protein
VYLIEKSWKRLSVPCILSPKKIPELLHPRKHIFFSSYFLFQKRRNIYIFHQHKLQTKLRALEQYGEALNQQAGSFSVVSMSVSIYQRRQCKRCKGTLTCTCDINIYLWYIISCGGLIPVPIINSAHYPHGQEGDGEKVKGNIRMTYAFPSIDSPVVLHKKPTELPELYVPFEGSVVLGPVR